LLHKTNYAELLADAEPALDTIQLGNQSYGTIEGPLPRAVPIESAKDTAPT